MFHFGPAEDINIKDEEKMEIFYKVLYRSFKTLRWILFYISQVVTQ